MRSDVQCLKTLRKRTQSQQRQCRNTVDEVKEVRWVRTTEKTVQKIKYEIQKLSIKTQTRFDSEIHNCYAPY